MAYCPTMWHIFAPFFSLLRIYLLPWKSALNQVSSDYHTYHRTNVSSLARRNHDHHCPWLRYHRACNRLPSARVQVSSFLSRPRAQPLLSQTASLLKKVKIHSRFRWKRFPSNRPFRLSWNFSNRTEDVAVGDIIISCIKTSHHVLLLLHLPLIHQRQCSPPFNLPLSPHPCRSWNVT